MSTSLICRPILTLALTLLSLAGTLTAPATAGEQIVLPFDCNIVGGRVQVRPSGDQAYRIYGARRQEQYRACSEQSPDRCRTFLVHSFKMACGRDRAEWPEVYAAIAKVTDGRAFFNNDGALYYRMGPREPRDSYPFPEPRRPSGIVEMPAGFAPMAGIDAIFTPLDPRVAELEDGPAPDAPDPDARAYRDAETASRRNEGGFAPALTPKAAEKPKVVETPKIAEAPKPVEPPKSQVVLEPKPLETASTDKPAAASSATEASRASEGAPPTETAAPLAPTILNNPAAKEVETASQTETVVAAAEIPSGPPTTTAAIPNVGSRVEGWSANGGTRLSVPPLAVAILIAAATLAILLVILKKQAAVPAAAGPLRIPIEPTLPGFDPPRASTGQALTVRATPEPPSLSTGTPSTDLPVTRADALALLGLNADASEAVIRKVVEALRQSWHPDLATGDADRAAREVRIKAINVAAGILLPKTIT
jgi:hypothetical protein